MVVSNSPQKIVMLLSNGFRPDPRVFEEAKSLVNNGYKVTILAWDRECSFKKEEDTSGVHIERIQIKSYYGRGTHQIFFFLLFWMLVLGKVLFKKLDMIYCHDFDTLPIGYILAKIKRCKIVYDSHESYVEMLDNNVSGIFKVIILSLENFLLRRVDAVITVGEILSKYLKERGAKKVTVVGNWKKLSDYLFPIGIVEKKRKELGIEDKFVIVYIGFLNFDRRILELIDAIENNNDYFLLIGGTGTLEQEIMNRAIGSTNMRWLGYVDNSKIPLYTSASDVVYFAWNEKSPNSKYISTNKMFEALASGKPMIASDCGENRGIIGRGECGVLLSGYSKEQILKALNNIKENYQRYSKNALLLAKSFYNWSIAEKRLVSLISSVLAK